jgi:hypothetical protein
VISPNHMKKTKSILLSSLLFTIAAFIIIISAQYSIKPEDVEAQAVATSTPTTRLTGYAWSENIGWISFRDGATPVKVESDGDLVGYAWSENIGWIQFGGLSGFPVTPYESNSNAKLTGQTLSGWARAVAGISGDNRGGWDGWIALKGVRIQLNSTALASNPAPAFVSGCTSTGCTNGAAWGSDVVGWVDFSGVTTMEQKLSCTGSYGTTIPDGSNFTFYSVPDADGNCTTQEKECKNGVLTPNSASFTELSCGNTKKDCTRGGKTFKDGDKVIFYAKAIAGIGQTCESLKTELTCTDGKFFDKDGNQDTGTINKNLKCINNPTYIEQ